MRVFHNITEVKNIANPVVTIGTFDGVHIGHQTIFNKMKNMADKVGGETVVITFHPHPRQVLNIDRTNLKFICTQEDKLKKFEELGIDNVIIIQFTKEFSRTPSETFIKEYIVDHLHPKILVVGYDHHFGKNRIGDFGLLYSMEKRYGFKVERIDVQDVEHIAISSTKVRNALNNGNVRRANSLLGYYYNISGIVIHGNEIGRTLGFPTANINIESEYMLINNPGVYACLVEYNNKTYHGMANIGRRPTVDKGDNDALITEVNIFEFDEDIYDKTIRVYFIDRIRDEEKFDDLDSLKAQLTKDKEQARELLDKI